MLQLIYWITNKYTKHILSQSAGGGAVEYTNCFSAEALDSPPNEYPEYHTKQSDGEVPVKL